MKARVTNQIHPLDTSNQIRADFLLNLTPTIVQMVEYEPEQDPIFPDFEICTFLYIYKLLVSKLRPACFFSHKNTTLEFGTCKIICVSVCIDWELQ